MRTGWRFTNTLCLAVCLIVPGLLRAAHAQEARDDRPNILVVVTDDQGLGQTPCYLDLLPAASAPIPPATPRYVCDMDRATKCARTAMPNLESLAQRGVTFTQAYVASPLSGPSRAALLSARYPQRYGLYGNRDADAAGLPVSETCLPALLKDAGYRIIATHVEHGQPIDDMPFDTPTALVFGNERDGVSDEMLAHADARVVVPMAGFTRSFNISVAAALCLYHIRQARSARFGRHGDLSADETRLLTAVYYVQSVDFSKRVLLRARGKAAKR